MLQKCVYIQSKKDFTDDFHSEEVLICGVNIKPYRHKEIIKPMIPDKTVTSWGVFLHLRLSNGDQYDAVWKLDKTVVSEWNDVPCIAKMKKVKKNKLGKGYIQESPIPTILRAVGINEWVELIGTNVRMKPLNAPCSGRNGFGISPVDEASGRWFYPDYFEIHTLSEQSDDCESDDGTYDYRSRVVEWIKAIPANMEYPNSVEDKDLRNDIIVALVQNGRDSDGDFIELNGVNYFVHALKGVIAISSDTSGKEDTKNTSFKCFDTLSIFLERVSKSNEGCISQEDQDKFKIKFTDLYNDCFLPNVKPIKAYGIDKINKLMKMQSIGYKLKIVYTNIDKGISRHWVLTEHDWNNDTK